MALQITGIRKPGSRDSHEAISHYRWRKDHNGETGIDARLDVISYLERNNEKAYVSVGGSTAWCGIRTNQYGTKYLQTYADGKWDDNLLSLPEV
ncbi:MAG TPA: DUF3892 domain-containing protein [Candidatus Saccharimonadales bacterium]|nr:DUF3892 domain-containing protein [Candidatus Saccharimonadales bacterium]